MSFWKGFIFTHSQKIGLIGLIGLMILGLVAIGIFQYVDRSSQQVQVNQRLPELPQESSSPRLKVQKEKKQAVQAFDINLADSSQWASLRGIGPVLSQRIVRFRTAKSGFQSVEDVKAVYGLKEEVFSQIRPYLFVDPATIPPRQHARHEQVHADKSPRQIQPIDINLATAEEFQVLSGIGPVLSKRIIKFRSAIGGFEAVDQLKKVYGLPPEVFESIESSLFVATSSRDSLLALHKQKDASTSYQRRASPVRSDTFPDSENIPAAGISRGEPAMLDLNEADSMSLVTLPGIGAWTASQIIGYRKRIGFYASVQQLKDIPRLTDKNFQRMAPYLRVSDLSPFAKKDLNRINEWGLRVHGPISDSLAQQIISSRNQLGRFASWQELRRIDGLEDSTISYLRIYFKL